MSLRWTLALLVVLLFGCSSSDSGPGDTSVKDDGVADSSATDLSADTTTVDTSLDQATPDDAALEVDTEAPYECSGVPTGRTLSAEADETFDLGPYLMQATPETIVVMWRTLEPEAGKVSFGPSGENLDLVVEETIPTLVHEVTLESLEPNTDYDYQVESGGRTSAVHTFHSSMKEDRPFRFAVFGDNQNGPNVLIKVVAQILEFGPYLVLGVGDHVQEGNMAALWKEQLFGPARSLFHQASFYATMGNHESRSQDYFDLYSYPNPSDDPEHEAYYAFTYGSVFFLCLDSMTLLCPLGDVDTPESEWIKEVLESPEAKNAKWRFAYSHTPAWTESWSPGECTFSGNKCMQDWLIPLLAEHGFHGFFSGHTHDYERGYYDGLIHFITGGAGGHLDEWCLDHEGTTVVYQGHNHLEVDVGCDSVRIQAVNLDGDVVDWVEFGPETPVNIIDEGPADNLPELIVNEASPTLD